MAQPIWHEALKHCSQDVIQASVLRWHGIRKPDQLRSGIEHIGKEFVDHESHK